MRTAPGFQKVYVTALLSCLRGATHVLHSKRLTELPQWLHLRRGVATPVRIALSVVFAALFLLGPLANTALVQAQGNPDFFLAENGVTVLCPDADVGDTGEIDGTTYTKRDRAGLDALIEDDENNSLLATSCTSGIESMQSLLGGRVLF